MHAHVAEREVVLHRIRRIEAAQRCGDLRRHPPARAPVPRQPQAPPQPDDVHVERHDQLRRRQPRPDAQIDRVGPHHPPQEQVHALARAAGSTAAGRSRRRRSAGVARPGGRDRAPGRGSRTTRWPRRRRRKRGRAPSQEERLDRPGLGRSSGAGRARAGRDRLRASSGARGARTRPRPATGRSARRRTAGVGPRTASSRSIDCRTLATRPNARAAAQNPTTSRSAGIRVAADDLDRVRDRRRPVVVVVEAVEGFLQARGRSTGLAPRARSASARRPARRARACPLGLRLVMPPRPPPRTPPPRRRRRSRRPSCRRRSSRPPPRAASTRRTGSCAIATARRRRPRWWSPTAR